MRRLAVLLIVLATSLPLLAEDWTTEDGKTYRNVTVIAQEDDGVRITYTGGVGKIPYYELSPDLQKRFGLDPAAMEAKRKAAEKAQADAAAAAAATAAAAQANPQAGANPQPAAQPGVNPQAAAQPGANPQPGAQPGVPPQPGAQPGATPQPSQPSVNPATHVEIKQPYPGSKFSYNEGLDVCYLDSPAVSVFSVSPAGAAPAPTNAPGQGTLTLRITTDGHHPEAPDQVEATFSSAVAMKNLPADRKYLFLVDGAYVPVNEIEGNNSDSSSGADQASQTISFYLSPEQANSIFKARNVNFSVGSNNYRIDEAGISIFRKYFDDVDRLPPASTSFIRTYHKFLARLPSIITIISTVCEYIILGSFTILVAATIAAFVLGMSRFMKM